MKTAFLLFFLALVVAEGLYLRRTQTDIQSSSFVQEHSVMLRKDGFSPKELTVKRHDRVRFSTTEGKPFWPASDLHPSHEIYPEFDSKQPVPAEEEWSFIFEETGTWRYHDHLAPLFRGTIRVVD